MQRIGIVLGGGGVRSMAHIGVLRELTKLGLPIHHVAGTSAGSIIGALFAAGIPLNRVEQEARSLNWRTIFEPSILWRQAITGVRLMRYLERLFGERTTFESLQFPLSITAVELVHGRMVVFDEGPLLPAIRASIALPGAIRPVVGDNGTLFVDGGVLGTVPTQTLRQAGCDVVIAVDVRGAWGVMPNRVQRWRRTHLIHRLAEVMTGYITDLALEQADIVLRPDVGGIGSFDVGKIGQCIDAGAEAIVELRDRLSTWTPARNAADMVQSGSIADGVPVPSLSNPI